MPLNTPIASIVTSSIGRGAELKYGPGNNQYARASDVNPVIDYLNLRAGSNVTAQSVSAASYTYSTATYAGKITYTATIAATGTTDLTIGNPAITSSSIVYAVVTGNTGGAPIVQKVVCTAGQAVVTVYNYTTAGSVCTISFIVF